jgi:hypothetical protein
MRNLILGLAAVIALGLASREARADDGRIEINQARALAGGVTPGDAPGFPVTISVPGSYVLTSNLAAPAGDGIAASVAGVAIDLNGFEVVGPVVCTGLGSEVSCSSGSGYGVSLGNDSAVHDGRVRGFAYGIWTGDRAQIRQLIADSNRYDGITTGTGSIVRESIAFRNGQNGMGSEYGDLRIEASIGSSNRAFGFVTDGGRVTIAGCTAHDNGYIGIGVWGVVRESSAYLNRSNGIEVFVGSVVSDNAAYQNGGYGISAGSGTTVQGNSVAKNSSIGLILSADTSYRENTISGNGGTVTGGVNMGSNSCNGAATCP